MEVERRGHIGWGCMLSRRGGFVVESIANAKWLDRIRGVGVVGSLGWGSCIVAGSGFPSWGIVA